MLITFADSSCMQGLILSVSGKRMRVAVKDHDDPIEFTQCDDSWLAEDGRPVTFVFPLGILESQEIMTAIEEVTVEHLAAPRSCSAGGECLLRRLAVGHNPS